MKNKPAVLIALAGVLLAAAGAARARLAASAPEAVGEWDTYTEPVTAWWEDLTQEVQENTVPYVPVIQDGQIAAFRQAIMQAEGTAGQGDPFRVCFGYKHTIQSFADHPAVTKEWNGEPLPPAMCEAAGFGPGCVSTAAGAFQITRPTWVRVQRKLKLPDFSPASQIAACDELLRERGAWDKILAGDIPAAVAAAKKEWASLPGAGYKQGERSIAWIIDKFTAAGGVLA